MDESETFARQTLISLGCKNLQFEPDGNIPPDFLIDGRIAVEVRRLNQNHIKGQKSEGLEEAAIPLTREMKRLLASFGPPTQGKSWGVFCRFSRPIQRWKKMGPPIKQKLDEFFRQSEHKAKTILVTENFSLRLFEYPKLRTDFFIYCGQSDQESGGWVIEEMTKNLQLCIDEKAEKIEKHHSKYPEWWLLFDDRIGYGFAPDDAELEQLNGQVSIPDCWDKVLLFNPLDPTHVIEIKGS